MSLCVPDCVLNCQGLRGLIHDICDFRVRMNQVDRNVSRFDRLFIEHAIAGNRIEIQSLEYILARTDNAEYRGLIQMMITMHTANLEMALEIADEIGADKTPDLTNMRVYPKTPEYDLGMRRMNLVTRFLDPLMSSADGSTPTAVATTGTPFPTATGTGLPSLTHTTINTNTAIVTPSGTATSVPTGTGTATQANTATGTAISTGTGTPAVTGTGTISTGTNTAVVTGTGTAVSTGTGTTPSETVTAVVTGTATGISTALPTGSPTGTAFPTTTTTASPTVVPSREGFHMLSLNVLEDEHTMHIEMALVAQRLARNSEIRAFAKHAADVAKLHHILINDLQYRWTHNFTLPEPHFEEDYQSPRRLEATDEDN